MRIPAPLQLSPCSSGYLDAFRAVSALCVMFSHLRGFCFVDYEYAHNQTPYLRAFYSATALGPQSVMEFFVLSGLFISSSVLNKIRQETWSWRQYAIDRGARLYAVLIPGLLFGFAWDYLGIHAFNASAIYSGPLAPFGAHTPVDSLSWSAFLGNLFFLQNRFVPLF